MAKLSESQVWACVYVYVSVSLGLFVTNGVRVGGRVTACLHVSNEIHVYCRWNEHVNSSERVKHVENIKQPSLLVMYHQSELDKNLHFFV